MTTKATIHQSVMTKDAIKNYEIDKEHVMNKEYVMEKEYVMTKGS